MMSSGVGYVLITSEKDSAINSTNARVLTVRYYKPTGDTVKYSNIYTFSESGKVYYWKNMQFHLLYNFNSVKDTVWNIFNIDSNPCGKDSTGVVKVDYVQTEQINQKSFKCLFVSPVEPSIWTFRKIIEPIGSVDYMFPLPIFCGVADDMPFASPLRCYEDPNVGSISFLYGKTCDYLTTVYNQLLINEDKIKIYPNPANSKSEIIIESEKISIARIKVFSLGGQLLKTYNCDKAHEVKINTSDYSSNIYILKVYDSYGKVYTDKLIIE